MARGTPSLIRVATGLLCLAGAGCRFDSAGLPRDSSAAVEGRAPERSLRDRPPRSEASPLPDGCTACLPGGWTQTIASDRSPADAAQACPAGWKSFGTATAFEGLTGTGCSACACATPVGRSCDPAKFECQHNAACTNEGNCGNDGVTGDNGCVDFGCDNICSNVRVTTPGVPVGGSCASSGGEKLPYSWSSAHDLCVPATASSACSRACLPSGGSFAHQGCLVTAGEESCPAGFPSRLLFYAGAADTRSCSCGACGSPAGGTCAATVTLYPCAGCGDGATGQFNATNGLCYAADKAISCDGTNPAIRSARYAGMTAPGSCAPAQVSQTGQVTPSGPMTVCCP